MGSVSDRVTIQELVEAYHYETYSGKLVRYSTGKPVGTPNNKGYLVFGHRKNGKTTSISVHRAAWAIFHGEWSIGVLDHIDHNKTNNRMTNLREVTRRQNCMHRIEHPMLGIRIERNSGYSARFQGKHLGVFKTLNEAKARYLEEKMKDADYVSMLPLQALAK